MEGVKINLISYFCLFILYFITFIMFTFFKKKYEKNLSIVIFICCILQSVPWFLQMGRNLYTKDVTWLAFNAFNFYFNQTFHNLFNMNKWLHFIIISINTFGIIISLEIYGDIDS